MKFGLQPGQDNTKRPALFKKKKNWNWNFASPPFVEKCMAIEEREAMGRTKLSLRHSCTAF